MGRAASPRGYTLPAPPWVVRHRGYKAWFSCLHLGQHRRATPDPVLSVGWLRPRWRPHHRPASPLPNSSFLATRHLTGVSPESILSKTCAHDCLPQRHVQVSPGMGGLVKLCSAMTLERHAVIFWPYFQVLGYFSLTEVSKNLWNEQTRVGGKAPHTWTNIARSQNQPPGPREALGTHRQLSPGKGEESDWSAVGAWDQVRFSTSREE